MCWLKWKHAVISLCLNLVSCKQSCVLPLTWWAPVGNWHFSGCLKHRCALGQLLPSGTSTLEVRQESGKYLLVITIVHTIHFAVPCIHLLYMGWELAQVHHFWAGGVKQRQGQMMGDAFCIDHRSALLWLWGYTQKEEGIAVGVWGKPWGLHPSLENLKRAIGALSKRCVLRQHFCIPEKKLRRPKLGNFAPLHFSQRPAGSLEGCRKPDALGPCLTTLATSCPLWSVSWTGQRPQAGQTHPWPPSPSPLKCQHISLPHSAVCPSSHICFVPLGSGACVFPPHFE